MNENLIISIYHYFFLFLALLVAVLAFGAATKVWIFKNISTQHQNALIGTFLLGAAGAVVVNYQALPDLEVRRAEHYLFSLDYYDNFAALYHSSAKKKDFKECFVQPDKTQSKNSDRCKSLKTNINTMASSLSARGMGEMFLALSTSDLYEGLVTYSFPDDNRPISMSLDGVREDEDTIILNFIQPVRFIQDLKPYKGVENKELLEIKYRKRPPFSFSIVFDKLETKDIFKGVLYHPSVTVDCNILDISIEKTIVRSSMDMLIPDKKQLINDPSKDSQHCYAPLAVATIVPTF